MKKIFDSIPSYFVNFPNLCSYNFKNVRPMKRVKHNKNKNLAIFIFAIPSAMFLLSFASVPLYNLFVKLLVMEEQHKKFLNHQL